MGQLKSVKSSATKAASSIKASEKKLKATPKQKVTTTTVTLKSTKVEKPIEALKSVSVRSTPPTGPTTIERFKKELLRRREEIIVYLQKIEEHGVDINSGPGDMADKSEEVESWITRESMNQHATLELNHVNAALSRMESGNFGVCISCEEAIPLSRLRARPNATLCLSCQEMTERRAAGVRRTPGTTTFN